MFRLLPPPHHQRPNPPSWRFPCAETEARRCEDLRQQHLSPDGACVWTMRLCVRTRSPLVFVWALARPAGVLILLVGVGRLTATAALMPDRAAKV